MSINKNTKDIRIFIDGELVQNGKIYAINNPLYLGNHEGINRFVGGYSLIEVYDRYCNDYTEFTNMVYNASSGGGTDAALYELPEVKTFNGTSDYIDTGVQLFDENKDFTIFIDFTSSDKQSNYSPIDETPLAILHSIKEDRPWPGIDIAIHTHDFNPEVNDCSVNRGETIASKRGIFVNSLSLGIGYKDTNNHKIVITKSMADRKIFVYDNQGKVGEISGDLVTATFEQNVLLGAYQNTSGVKGRYWKGTINQCKIWLKLLNEDEITSLLS